jgi:ABC-type antimicrobial peptide transport system permease subunit
MTHLVWRVAVAQRTREFGVRRALGASDDELMRIILTHALTPVLLGLAVGLPAARAVSSLAEAALVSATARDPVLSNNSIEAPTSPERPLQLPWARRRARCGSDTLRP